MLVSNLLPIIIEEKDFEAGKLALKLAYTRAVIVQLHIRSTVVGTSIEMKDGRQDDFIDHIR